jgi:hypothetical protein
MYLPDRIIQPLQRNVKLIFLPEFPAALSTKTPQKKLPKIR